MKKTIKINNNDNVIIALEELYPGDKVIYQDSKNHNEITILQNIPFGHKVAIKPIKIGENIIKYGFPIGHATQIIQAGEHVHTFNIKTNLAELNQYQYQPVDEIITTSLPDREVKIYRRENHSVGIRNELWIIPTVGCVNGIANQIRKQILSELEQDI